MRLVDLGLGSFRLRIKARVAIFFVGKKVNCLRMVLDAREANSLHRRPPHTGLGSAGALALLDLSAQALAADGRLPEELRLHGSGVDIMDGYYQFKVPQLGSYFGVDFPERADAFGCTKVYCEDSGLFMPVEPDRKVFFVFDGLSMGWSWALHFCRCVTEDVMQTALRPARGLAPPGHPPGRATFSRLQGHRRPWGSLRRQREHHRLERRLRRGRLTGRHDRARSAGLEVPRDRGGDGRLRDRRCGGALL